MKLQRVYLDTSVLGGCFDTEFAPWSAGLMEDFRANRLKALLSGLVATEVAAAPLNVQSLYAELVMLQAEVLPVTEEALELAGAYQAHGILTEKYYPDGLHIAVATVFEADVLVSWNFRHIVRLDRIRLFNAVNQELGYKPVQIYTPREVTTYGR